MHLSGHSFASINVPCFLSAYLLSTAFKDYKTVLLNDRLFSLLFSKEIILQSLTIFTFSCNYPNDQHWIVWIEILIFYYHQLLSHVIRLLKASIPHIVGRPVAPITAYLSVFVPYLDSCSSAVLISPFPGAGRFLRYCFTMCEATGNTCLLGRCWLMSDT